MVTIALLLMKIWLVVQKRVNFIPQRKCKISLKFLSIRAFLTFYFPSSAYYEIIPIA